jgi:hypothetical protein
MNRQDRAGWNWLATLVMGILIILACAFLLVCGSGWRTTMRQIMSSHQVQ